MPNELQSRYIGVIVVDDHDLVRRGVTSALAELPDMRVLGEAASGEEAIRLVREKLPDVVLMDLRMPGMGGLEAARRIGITHPQTCVIAVTAWDSEPWQRLEQSHIAACVGKSVRVADLGATIRRALVSHRRGDRAHTINEPSCNPFDTLSAREMQVCTLLLAGYHTPRIAKQMFIAPKTVHSFRYRIFEKLGIDSDIGLTKLALAYGVSGVRDSDPSGHPP